MDSERVIAVSKTIQEFMGERFYLCGKYFQHRGKRLHRAVWEAFNGKIPEGYHVHHLDENRSNNQIENLVLLPGIEHVRNHANEPQRKPAERRAIRKAILAAPEWHHSGQGKAWHSQHALHYWADAPENEYRCSMCGNVFSSRAVRRGGNHFCCANCRAKYGRKKRAGLL